MTNYYPPSRPRRVHNLKGLVTDAARDFGDKDYLVYKRAGQLESLTFNGLEERVCALSEAIFDSGLSGEAIAVIGETSPEWIITYIAAICSGSTIVPLDKELAQNEIANFIAKVGCKAVVFSEKYASYFENESDFPSVEYFVSFSTKGGEAAKSYYDCYDEKIGKGRCTILDMLGRGRKLFADGSRKFLDHKHDLDKTCIILFTSGTTGTSKGVELCERNLVSNISGAYNMVNFTEDDVLVSVLPIHHTYEMTCGILTPILIGATVCINDSLKHVLRDFQLYKPTGLLLVPLFVNTIYKKIWDTAQKQKKTAFLKGGLAVSGALRKVGIDPRKALFKSVNAAFGGRLKTIICGGAPLSADLVNQFEEFGITIYQGYGITECAPLISVCPPTVNRPGSVGLPMPGVEVKIDFEENEEWGEILAKGPNVMNGYYKDPENTAAVLNEDGWFRTGDYGYVDEDGFVYITGRKKNVIVLNNGKNVFPEEIEEYLSKIELVSECVVIGRTSEGDDTVNVTAIVYPNFALAEEKGLTDLNQIGEEIKGEVAKLNRSLPSFKQIRGVELRKTEFEKNSSRKIQRFKIK